MFEQFIKRENDIFDILQLFLDNNLNFILIGGYAVSAFKHRFSIDADIVIKSEDYGKFEILLKENDFEKIISKELKNIYSSKFVRFQKKKELTISVDLMIDGVGIRQIESAIGFDKINKNSIKKKIKGLEKEIIVKIPIKELLIAMKLQSGRATDFRDIIALSENIDINKIKEFLNNNKKVLNNIKELISLIDKKEFIDSFKGVFMEKKFDINLKNIKKLEEIYLK